MKQTSYDIPLAGLLLALALSLPFWAGDYMLGVGFTLAMWLAMVQSWSLLSATTGYISLGHAVFCGIGAYAMILALPVMGIAGSVLFGGAMAGLAALLIGLPVMRVRGPYFVILTFGLAELAKAIVMQVETSLGQFSRLIFNAPPLATLYWAMLALVVIAVGAAWLLNRSRLGAGLVAIRENEEAAEAVGVPVARMKTIALVLSAVIPGMIGGLLTLRSSYFDASQAFDPVLSFTIVTMAIVGGLRSPRGPFLGAIAFVLLSEALWLRLPQLYMIALGALLIAFILFAPEGLAGMVSRLFPSRRSTGKDASHGNA